METVIRGSSWAEVKQEKQEIGNGNLDQAIRKCNQKTGSNECKMDAPETALNISII